MIGPLARIIVRYTAGALVMAGWIGGEFGDQLSADPDILMAVGLGLSLTVEGFYVFARRLGWAT